MGLYRSTKWSTMLVGAAIVTSGLTTAPAGAARAVVHRQNRHPGISCKGFTIRRNDGSGVTTMYRFSGVRAVRVQCDQVRRILRDDLTGSGRALGPGANWGMSVDGWTVVLTSTVEGYRGKAQFHAGYTIAAVG